MPHDKQCQSKGLSPVLFFLICHIKCENSDILMIFKKIKHRVFSGEKDFSFSHLPNRSFCLPPSEISVFTRNTVLMYSNYREKISRTPVTILS